MHLQIVTQLNELLEDPSISSSGESTFWCHPSTGISLRALMLSPEYPHPKTKASSQADRDRACGRVGLDACLLYSLPLEFVSTRNSFPSSTAFHPSLFSTTSRHQRFDIIVGPKLVLGFTEWQAHTRTENCLGVKSKCSQNLPRHRHMLTAHRMFNNPDFSDIKVKAGAYGPIYAHKAILSLGSPWFARAFSEGPKVSFPVPASSI